MAGDFLSSLRGPLDVLRDRYNRSEYVAPDPLQCLLPYAEPCDREIVALVASALAFGNVKQILRSVEAVLDRMPNPHRFVTSHRLSGFKRTFEGFRHRFVDGMDVSRLLFAAGRVVERHGSLGACLTSKVERGDEDAMPALTAFVSEIRSHYGEGKCYLVPSPADGSACKRLNLLLRWMVRRDDVDPGGWDMSPSLLIVPLDTHMHRIARRLGLTQRAQADLRTAREITRAFRRIAPEDPVRYDFALTRLGIRDDGDGEAFFQACGLPSQGVDAGGKPRGRVSRS